MRDPVDAHEAHQRLTAFVRRWMPELGDHDRPDVVQEAIVNAMESPRSGTMTFPYLYRLARAARTYHLIGGRRGQINELEHVAGATVDRRVAMMEQTLQRHLTPSEIARLVATIAAETDRRRTHRAVAPDFMQRRRRTLSVEAPSGGGGRRTVGDRLEDVAAARDLEAVEGHDPLSDVVELMDRMRADGAWSVLPAVERRVLVWQAFAARRGAPSPVGASLSPRQRQRASTVVRGAGGAQALAVTFHESEACEERYREGLFAPFGRTTERERVAIVDTVEDLGRRADEVWSACVSTATAYRYTRRSPVHRASTWHVFAAAHGAPAPVPASLTQEQCTRAAAAVAVVGGVAAVARDFHESGVAAREVRAMFAPFGRLDRVQRAAVADALSAAGGHAEEIWAGCLAIATTVEPAASRPQDVTCWALACPGGSAVRTEDPAA